jgi:hypothetical protein
VTAGRCLPVVVLTKPGPTCRLSARRREKVNASRFGFRFFFHLSFAPPYGGQVGGPGRIRPTGFAFSFTFHSHRHTADQWADRAGSALPVSLFLSPFIRTAMRRTSGRARRSRPTILPPVGLGRRAPPTCRLSARCREKVNASRFGFRFFFHLSFAPPCGGSVGGPGRIRPTGFAFSFTFHSHRHTADQWARPAVTPYRPRSVFLFSPTPTTPKQYRWHR